MSKNFKLIFFKLTKYIIVAFIILLISGCSFNKKYKLSLEEAVAWTRLRFAIAESVLYDGSTSLTSSDVNTLKSLSKKTGKNNEWFSENDILYVAYGKTMDTEKYQISSLCSKYYCATFKIEKKENDYYLLEYYFEKSDERGYDLFIIDQLDLSED